MVTDKLYCVDLLVKLRKCGLTCNIIYSPNLTGKGGTYILHNLIANVAFLTSMSSQRSSNLSSNENRFSMIIFLLWFIYGSNVSQRYSVGRKNVLFIYIPIIWKLFCKENVRFASVANFTSKIPISDFLIKLHNFPLIKNWQFNCV